MSRASPQAAAERSPAPPGEHRTGEDWGEANPLISWSFPYACGGLGMGSSMPKLPPGEGGVWGEAPRCTGCRESPINLRDQRNIKLAAHTHRAPVAARNGYTDCESANSERSA